MHGFVKVAALPLALLALACGKTEQRTASKGMDAGLQQDLELAASPSLELASSARAKKAQMVVSDIERTPGTVAVHAVSHNARAPRAPAAPARKPAVVAVQKPGPAQPPPTPAPPIVVAQVPTPPEAEAQPTAAARPAPPAVAYPAPGSYPEGDRGRSGLGGIIGVVLRGGDVDGDHCEPHHGGVLVNNRMPVRFPRRSTFPIHP
ncbi:MAG TPA: hypothetical protein VFW98_00305 [Gemmatimonadaceae bacterium]|nr:hypothetical protein [Gemmatimonadaceae bacterium]